MYFIQDLYNIKNCVLQDTSCTACLYIEPPQKNYLNSPLP